MLLQGLKGTPVTDEIVLRSCLQRVNCQELSKSARCFALINHFRSYSKQKMLGLQTITILPRSVILELRMANNLMFYDLCPSMFSLK